MVSYGLLGAMAGAGQALQTIGVSLEQRRQQALQALREEAKHQRQRVEKIEDDQRDFGQQVAITGLREERQDKRHTLSLTTQRDIARENREFRATEEEKERAFKAEQAEKERAARKELARLNSSLAGERDRASIALRNQLQAETTQGVTYGEPDANGMAEIIIIKKNGTLLPTGRRAYRPPRVSGSSFELPDPDDE